MKKIIICFVKSRKNLNCKFVEVSIMYYFYCREKKSKFAIHNSKLNSKLTFLKNYVTVL